jgi:hypothetical protein
MARPRGDTVMRRKGARSYDRILAAAGPSKIEPIIPWEEPEEPKVDLSAENVPPECRGDLWAYLSIADKLELIARFKGWRFRRVAPLLKMNPSLRDRAENGEFDTLESLEAALAQEHRRRYCGAA